MKMKLLLKKLLIEKKEFVTSDELKEYCKSLELDYKTIVRYYESQGHLSRIFRGIFYIKYPEPVNTGRFQYNYLELVARGLKLKGVENWYFGLHTALKLNNLTHEHFTLDEVVNDIIFRPKPMTIVGYKFKFVKISKSLLHFGIKEENRIKYSDPEKTILDFIYIWRYNGKSSEKILFDISEWSKNISKEKILLYSKHYPKSVRQVVEMMIK